MTVLEIIQRSTDFLADKGVESPRLQIELLLAHVLKVARMKLYLNFERVLTEPELEQLRGLVRRRAGREPLQHILGTSSFAFIEIKVNGDVLIPRSETELLAERAWNFLASAGHPAPVFLDFGTGSGCLALAVGMKCPSAEIHALDISSAALAIARENAATLGLAGRIQFLRATDLTRFPPDCDFISWPRIRPTYQAEKVRAGARVRKHDPRLALAMDSLLIKGGVPLHGEVAISGAKNAVLPIMAATLLTSEPCVIRRVPNLSDVRFMGQILTWLGAQVRFDGDTVHPGPKNQRRRRLRFDPQDARLDLRHGPAAGPVAKGDRVAAGRLRDRRAARSTCTSKGFRRWGPKW